MSEGVESMEFLRKEETGPRGPRGHSFLLRWEETRGGPLQMSSQEVRQELRVSVQGPCFLWKVQV